MSKSPKSHHDSPPDRQGRTIAEVLNDSRPPFETVRDLSIRSGRPHPAPDSETPPEQTAAAGLDEESETQPFTDDLFSTSAPQDTKQSRQAVDVATQLSMERHGWKQTGEKSSLWVFEHRWPHLRDHAEGRNHGVQGK